MQESLKKVIHTRGVKATLLTLLGGIREILLSRRVMTTLSALKESTRKTIQIKSIIIRQSSLKKAVVKTFHNSRTQMRLTFGLAFRNATRSKYRSFLLILGILLTVALETGIVISVDTLYDDFILDHRQQNYTDITVHPKDWINLTSLQTLAKDVHKVSGVTTASPVYYMSANRFLDVEISDNVLVYGIDSKTHPDFSHLNVVTGERKVSGFTIMISESIQQTLGVEIGTPIPVVSDEIEINVTEVTVGGVMSDEPYFGNKLLHYMVLVDIEVLYDLILKDQRLSMTSLTGEIDASVDNLVGIKKIGERIKDAVGLDNYVLLEKDISEIESIGIRAYQTAMNLVILASFVVEFLFITNVLAIAINDRSKELGTLRAVGINTGQLIVVIALEILIYSIIGSILGVFAGISFSTLLVSLIDSFYIGLEIQKISIQSSSIIATFLSGIVVSLISGLYPLFLALNVPVVQNIHSRMRTAKSTKITGNWKYSIALGFLLSITGFTLQFFVGPSRFLDFSVLSVHFFVVILIFIGTLFLEIGILVFLPKIGMRMLVYFGIITRTISMRNIEREFQKSLFTILTSALALAFIIVTGLTSAAVIASVPAYFESQWGSIDLVAETRDNSLLSTSFTQQLDRRRDIRLSSFIQEARTEIGGENGYVFGVDPIRYSHFAEPVLDAIDEESSYVFLNETTQTTLNITSGALTTINVTNGLISHRLYQRIRPKIPLGSNVPIAINSTTTVNVTLSAIIQGNVFLNDGEYLYITSERFQEFFKSNLAKWFVCDVNGDVASVQLNLEASYVQFKEVIGVTFFRELIEESLVFQTAIFQVLFVESFILAAMAQFICILISTLRMEREMGIMRSLGLHKLNIFGIFMSESTALGFSALFIGLIDGLLGYILLAWYISLSIPIEIQFQLDRVLLWVIISFMITLASTILPSYRSSQKNIISTISGRPMVRSYVEKPVKPVFYRPSVFPSKKDIQEIQFYSSQLGIDLSAFSDSTSMWSFLKDKKLQIQTVFLILLAIVTLNYILDAQVIVRGLMPSDIIWRLILLVPSDDNFLDYYEDYQIMFFFINPLLLFVGLASIGPISYYFSHNVLPDNLIKNIIIGFIIGVISILVCYILNIIVMILFNIIVQSLLFESFFYTVTATDIFLIASLVLIMLLHLLIFQRIWAFLILQGSNPDLSIKDKLVWTKRAASKGQFGFILLLLTHILIQAILFMATQPQPTQPPEEPLPFFPSSQSFSLDPVAFLIVTGFEVGFFLLFIIYQLGKFSNQSHLFSGKTSLIKDESIKEDKTPLKLKPLPVSESSRSSGTSTDKDEITVKESNPLIKTSNDKK
ncbi:MAG: ABC transporter permease [Promethearchaeota archaeon]